MFDRDINIRGQYATYWKALSKIPGNAVETSNNFKIFDNYIHVFMVAPIIGMLHGRKGCPNPNDENKDTAGMMLEVQVKNLSRLKYIYRLIALLDDSSDLTAEEKIRFAFQESGNSEESEKGMHLYMAYFYGGLEILYETFVLQCITEEDFIVKMYDFLSEFKKEQGISGFELDIDSLLLN